jgi:hypothetical protein
MAIADQHFTFWQTDPAPGPENRILLAIGNVGHLVALKPDQFDVPH